MNPLFGQKPAILLKKDSSMDLIENFYEGIKTATLLNNSGGLLLQLKNQPQWSSPALAMHKPFHYTKNEVLH